MKNLIIIFSSQAAHIALLRRNPGTKGSPSSTQVAFLLPVVYPVKLVLTNRTECHSLQRLLKGLDVHVVRFFPGCLKIETTDVSEAEVGK